MSCGGFTPIFESYIVSALRFKYRGRFDIMLDILDQVKRDPDGKTRTEIKDEARLSNEQLQKYIDLLLLCDFIVGKNSRYGDREITRYSLTQHGQELVKQIRGLYFAWSMQKYSAV